MGNRNGFEFWLLCSYKYYMIVLLYDLLNFFYVFLSLIKKMDMSYLCFGVLFL